jgi:hypothetical protein
VAITANTTAAGDSLTISPTGDLKPFTSYTLVIDGFQDRGPNGDPTAPTREFQKFTTSFVTGQAAEVTAREVAFNETIEVNGAADGAFGFTSLEMSPDGKYLYAATMGGVIKRWDVSAADGSLSNEQTLSLGYFTNPPGSAGPRGSSGSPSTRRTRTCCG